MGFELKKHQIEPVSLFVENIRTKRPALVIGGTGTGKTVIAAKAVKIAQENNWLPSFSNKIASVLYLGPNPIQTQRVFHKEGVKNTAFLNYPSLRSSMGEMLIQWESKLRGNDIDYVPVWYNDELPDLIICDENQKLKNPSSQQSKCVLAAIEQGVNTIFMSATPFQKACEAHSIFMGLRLSDRFNTEKTIKIVCNYNNIYENSPINTKHVKEYIEQHHKLIQVKNARFPYPVKIKTTSIHFKTVEEEKFYNNSYLTYLEERRKHGKGDPQGIRAKWVAMQKFWEAVELIKSFHQAELAIARLKERPCQVVIACNFITPLRNVYRQLLKLGFPKERISYVIGGQSAKARQDQVDLFQEGKTDILLMTVASGGTGLDLPDDCEGKTKPRHVIVPLCWSVYHFLQLVGRVHRMSSRSISTEEILFYEGTIEGNDIQPRLEAKVDCIKELIDRKDSFVMDIFNKEVDEEMSEEINKHDKNEYTEHDEDGEEMMFDIGMLETVKG